MLKSIMCAIAAAMIITQAAALDTPHVAGDMNGWDPGVDAMEEAAPGSGVYEITYTGLAPDGRYEFKITDGTWDNAIPGSNSWLFADGSGEITITYDSNTYDDGWSPTFDRIILSTDPGTWTAAGGFQGWDNANPDTAMTDVGDALYMYETTGMTPACYTWKPVVTGSWDSISWDGRSINSADWTFCVNLESDTVRLWVDSFGGTAMYEVIPECFGDLDGSGDVGLSDLSTLLSNYGATEEVFYGDGDLDGDHDVDLADLSSLLSAYGTVCE